MALCCDLRHNERISIHAPRTGSDMSALGYQRYEYGISIHAPRTGSDRIHDFLIFPCQISIHAPRTGSDRRWYSSSLPTSPFQSTLPARGATGAACGSKSKRQISIHAPRTGSDPLTRWAFSAPPRFQSTLPARGATLNQRNTAPDCSNFNPRSPHGERRYAVHRYDLPPPISIHAPRTGSDQHSQHATLKITRFQSTLPARGATRWTTLSTSPRRRFQSTLPARGATDRGEGTRRKIAISIHAPRTGSDTLRLMFKEAHGYFNPRSPHGERPGRAE